MVIVMAIVGVLLALLLGAIVQLRESAQRAQCANNLAQLGIAMHHYIEERDRIPPYASGSGPNEIYGGWLIPLLPYIEQHVVYDQLRSMHQVKPQAPFKILSAGASALPSYTFPTMLCPSDPSPGSGVAQTNYLANWYAFSCGNQGFYFTPPRLSGLTDGLSNTIFFAEGYRVCDTLPRWALYSVYYHNFGITQDGRPSDDPSYLPDDYAMFQLQPRACDKLRAQTPHSAMQVALGDGAVRALRHDISPLAWKHLLKPNDGFPIGSDW